MNEITETMQLTLTIIGWIGAAGFATCGIPLAINIWRTHETAAMTWGFLFLWGLGEVFTLVYVLMLNYVTEIWQWPLIANYVFNLMLLVFYVVMKYFIESGKLT